MNGSAHLSMLLRKLTRRVDEREARRNMTAAGMLWIDRALLDLNFCVVELSRGGSSRWVGKGARKGGMDTRRDRTGNGKGNDRGIAKQKRGNRAETRYEMIENTQVVFFLVQDQRCWRIANAK